MNKERTLLILASVAMALVACTSDDAESSKAEQIELRLSGAISMTTRADYTPTQSTALTAGEAVYAWVYDAGANTPGTGTEAATEHVKAWSLSCGAAGVLTGTNKYYFPASGNTVNVYAVHANWATAPVEGTTTWADIQTVTHDVIANQSIAGNYELSDLLFARNSTITRDNSVKLLSFKHQLSKIEIHLIAGTGLVAADITGATVKIKNTKPTATVTLSKTADFGTVAVSGTPADIQCRMQNRTDVQVNVADPGDPAVMKNAYAFAEAIIVPQYFDDAYDGTGAAMQFLEITLPNNGITLYSTIKTQFEKGKKYGYNVTVNSTGLDLKCQIDDWEDGTASPINTVAD